MPATRASVGGGSVIRSRKEGDCPGLRVLVASALLVRRVRRPVREESAVHGGSKAPTGRQRGRGRALGRRDGPGERTSGRRERESERADLPPPPPRKAAPGRRFTKKSRRRSSSAALLAALRERASRSFGASHGGFGLRAAGGWRLAAGGSSALPVFSPRFVWAPVCGGVCLAVRSTASGPRLGSLAVDWMASRA